MVPEEQMQAALRTMLGARPLTPRSFEQIRDRIAERAANRTRRRRAALVVSTAAVVIVGAGAIVIATSGPDDLAPADPAPAPTFDYQGPVTKTTVDPGDGVRFDPPGTRQAAISPEDAYATCSNGILSCAPGSPTIFLASVTMTSSGETDGRGGIIPVMDGTLAYVLKWSDVVCAPVGPAHLGTSAASASISTCTEQTFIDAKNGRPLLQVSVGNP